MGPGGGGISTSDGRLTMATYIVQGRYSGDAVKAMAGNPDDRREAVAAMLNKSGFTLKDYYVTLGEYDFLIVSEGPAEGADILVPLIVAAASGSVGDLRTTVAFSTADLKDACGKAGSILGSFRPAGG